MAHYAFLDENNIVTEVIVGIDETELIEGKEPETWYGQFRGQRCVRTSYNGNIRQNFAGIGFTYDDEADVFIPPKPFNSWLLNKKNYQWFPPKPYPEDGAQNQADIDEGKPVYQWDEDTVNWIEI